MVNTLSTIGINVEQDGVSNRSIRYPQQTHVSRGKECMTLTSLKPNAEPYNLVTADVMKVSLHWLPAPPYNVATPTG